MRRDRIIVGIGGFVLLCFVVLLLFLGGAALLGGGEGIEEGRERERGLGMTLAFKEEWVSVAWIV